MTHYVEASGLSVAEDLYQFIEAEALPGSAVDSSTFWAGASRLIHDLMPRNRELLEIRDHLQAQLDGFHRANPGVPDLDEYKSFLTGIGYLETEPANVEIETNNIDPEMSLLAGPQLVVPALNSRFAINAANARWGSLYDALYGTDAVDERGLLAPGSAYNPARGAVVVQRGRALLDECAPLASGSHAEAVEYLIDESGLAVRFVHGAITRLIDPAALVGFTGEPSSPTSILFVHHGLHVEVEFDRADAIGKLDLAGVKDILMESAITTIVDLEDSVAAVDAEDKVAAYRNWLLLMKGELSAEVVKSGSVIHRTMNPDRIITSPSGNERLLRSRSLLLLRHVGLHMYTDAVLDSDGREIPEGILDALVATLGSLHDLRGDSRLTNSHARAIYVVKPKLHGSREVAFTAELFRRVEELLGLEPLTMKIGLMDEERRTSANLTAAIAECRDRIVFINSGFLDRTGDEIHTSFHAGPFVRKKELSRQPFIIAYEDRNVDAGLAAGFRGRAQIGKGMWAKPDLMTEMLAEKGAQLRAGASTAWVPSPSAATLHALHYHHIDVPAVQLELLSRQRTGIDPLLCLPLAAAREWDNAERLSDLDDSVQSMLGYVVRWVDQGIGCSKVPDIHDVALMEDRATLRISSQLIANWLWHGVVTEDEVNDSLRRMAVVVDDQNASDSNYEPLVAGTPSLAFDATSRLIFDGSRQPNGYTEWILHRARRARKVELRSRSTATLPVS